MPNNAAPTRPEVVDGIALTRRESDVTTHAQPIVFVHGGCHGAWCWADWQTWFAGRGWRTVALDWRSHGASAPLEQQEWLKRPITAVTEDIEIAVADAVGSSGAEPIVIGHSMGGLASLTYAAIAARRLAALVLLAPVVPGRFATAPLDYDLDLTRPWDPPPPPVARQLFYSGVDDATAEKYYALLQPESPAAVWQATRWSADVDVANVRAPALVVAASEDLLVPPDYVRALGRALGAREIVREGVGHGLTLDPGWEQLAEDIHAWLIDITTGQQQ